MKKLLPLLATTLSFHCFAYDDAPSLSSNFSYDYAEARIGLSPFTIGAGASKSIHPNAHLIGQIDSKFDGDYDSGLGVGFHAPIHNWADITGNLLYRLANTGHETKSGFEINAGLRQWIAPQIELGGLLGYLVLDDDKDVTGSVFARFHATELFSVGAEARINQFYGDQAMFTTRFKF